MEAKQQAVQGNSNIVIPSDVGRYIGYTITPGDNSVPTLYFERGRYTPKHDSASQPIWHSNDGKPGYCGGNINEQGSIRYDEIIKQYQEQCYASDDHAEARLLAQMRIFCDDFKAGKFRSNNTIGDSRYFECYTKEGTPFFHRYRSRLIYATDPQCEFKEDYAFKALGKKI